jgi:hypothetical protein
MAFLPFSQLLDHLEEFDIEGDKPAHHAHRGLHFFGILWREDNTKGWFRAALKHVLAFLVEAGDDGIVVLEGNYERRQRYRVVSAVLMEGGIDRQLDPRESVDPPQPFNPRTKATSPVLVKKTPRASIEGSVIFAF